MCCKIQAWSLGKILKRHQCVRGVLLLREHGPCTITSRFKCHEPTHVHSQQVHQRGCDFDVDVVEDLLSNKLVRPARGAICTFPFCPCRKLKSLREHTRLTSHNTVVLIMYVFSQPRKRIPAVAITCVVSFEAVADSDMTFFAALTVRRHLCLTNLLFLSEKLFHLLFAKLMGFSPLPKTGGLGRHRALKYLEHVHLYIKEKLPHKQHDLSRLCAKRGLCCAT